MARGTRSKRLSAVNAPTLTGAGVMVWCVGETLLAKYRPFRVRQLLSTTALGKMSGKLYQSIPMSPPDYP